MSRPRIRTIKPEMFADEAFGTLSKDARLLFIGLITMADDDGRLRALPAAITGHVFPYDDVPLRKLTKWMKELADARLVLVYKSGGLPYAALPGWAKHQRINRPTPSTLPAPPTAASSGNAHDSFSEEAVNDHGADIDRSLPRAQAYAGADRIGSDQTPCSPPQAGDSEAPAKPPGGRQRDVVAYRQQMTAWAAEHFPGCSVSGLEHLVTWVRSRDLPATPDSVRTFAESAPQFAHVLEPAEAAS